MITSSVQTSSSHILLGKEVLFFSQNQYDECQKICTYIKNLIIEKKDIELKEFNLNSNSIPYLLEFRGFTFKGTDATGKQIELKEVDLSYGLEELKKKIKKSFDFSQKIEKTEEPIKKSIKDKNSTRDLIDHVKKVVTTLNYLRTLCIEGKENASRNKEILAEIIVKLKVIE